MTQSLQDIYAPQNKCFGCGPANEKGLRIKSFVEQDDKGGDVYVCTWTPEKHHEAFDGMLNGGICGALLDCHSNWAACVSLMKARNTEELPCTVTAEFSVKLRAPTPLAPLRLRARAVEVTGDKVTVEASIEAGGKITATCRGVFVAVKEGHPAFHRW
jgi:acyl-coenzyme A thioesterase PaaI-like protein